ncbi:MAG: DUF4118 domain-containing protein [Gallionella sp.]|nr:DUF4118 domain-containing protein [Gallionella sp.]MDD4960136.1 DUF4118 domain-containing protein [Gallionella sp.]
MFKGHLHENLTALVRRIKLGICGSFPALEEEKPLAINDYLMTVALMLLALYLRLAIAPVSAGLQYLTFFPAVTLATIYGGYRAGLLATAIGLVLATVVFTPPHYSFSLDVVQTSLWSNLVFLMDGIIVSFAIEALHRYRHKFSNELARSKEVNAKLQASEERLRITANEYKTILETTADGFWINALEDTRLVEVNQAYCDMTGYSRDELLQMHILNWRPTRIKRKSGAMYWRYAKAGKRILNRATAIRMDTRSMWRLRRSIWRRAEDVWWYLSVT